MPLYNDNAEGISYNNTVSNLQATNVQDAIDEINSEISVPRVNTVVRKITISTLASLSIAANFGHMRILAPESPTSVQGMLINKNILINSDASMSIESTATVQILGA